MRKTSTRSLRAIAFLGMALATASYAQTHRSSHKTPQLSSTGPEIVTVAGNGTSGYSGSGIPALQAKLKSPAGVAVDSFGNFYFADTKNQRVFKVNASTGVLSTYAGNGSQSFGGDGDQAASASLNTPTAIAFDAQNNLYIADSGNNVIRKVTFTTQIISTVAGNASMGFGFSGDTGPATSAQLYDPNGVGVDAKGNLYISDTSNCVIRVVNSKGIISTYAGVAPQKLVSYYAPCEYYNGSTYIQNGGYNGDGPATSSELNQPQGLALDAAGDLYIADTANSLIRKVSSGNLSTYAGSIPAGYGGDNGPAVAASLDLPQAVALDSAGDLYIADTGNSVIREVAASNQYISTVAGNGTSGYTGDKGLAINAELASPGGIAVDASGNVYIADTSNYVIRELPIDTVQVATPTFSTPAGTYDDPLEITLSDATAGASIFYTTDGSTPATTAGGSTKLYSGTAIPVDALGTTTINAIATATTTGLEPSVVATAAYTIVTPVLAPTITPPSAIYSSAQTVKISESTGGATIYYTIDGTIPTASSPKYTVPFIVDSDLTVQAIAIKGVVVSPEAWNNYVFVNSPSVLAYPATAIATPKATLNAVVNTLGIAGTYYFQYGTTAAALTTLTPTKSLGASANPVLVSAPVTGLTTKTTYYFQIVVTTKSGTSSGEVLSFTTN